MYGTCRLKQSCQISTFAIRGSLDSCRTPAPRMSAPTTEVAPIGRLRALCTLALPAFYPRTCGVQCPGDCRTGPCGPGVPTSTAIAPLIPLNVFRLPTLLTLYVVSAWSPHAHVINSFASLATSSGVTPGVFAYAAMMDPTSIPTFSFGVEF